MKQMTKILNNLKKLKIAIEPSKALMSQKKFLWFKVS